MLLVLAILTVIVMGVLGVEFAVGGRSLKTLEAIPSLQDAAEAPLVSVIIPARNEANAIRDALTSVLTQDYPNYEVLVLNDRSEDSTGAILDRMASSHPQLTVIHITQLPAGWLGKPYALWVGASRANGTIDLFTDADVVMDPSALSRAVHYLQVHRLDHVAVVPQIVLPGVALTTVVNGFMVVFASFYKPWKARDSNSRAYMGVGAFNLIRASVYQSIGTHRAIAMRPDDDMKLGKLVKRAGFRQDVMDGKPLVSVRWYLSLRAFIDGLMKNAFAGVNYRVGPLFGGVLLIGLLGLWPLVALWISDGAIRLLNGLAVALTGWLFWDTARLCKFSPWVALGYPFAVVVLIYIFVRATLMTLMRGGITWRGTHYPLAQLKANRV